MNKKDLVNKTVEVLRSNDIRKHITAQKTVFHISDDYGNQSDFTIRKSERGLLFTKGDVEAIIDTCLAVIEDAIKHGEEISIHGYGTLGVAYRVPKQIKHPVSGDTVDVCARYSPKVTFGQTLKMAAKVYEMSLEDRGGAANAD